MIVVFVADNSFTECRIMMPYCWIKGWVPLVETIGKFRCKNTLQHNADLHHATADGTRTAHEMSPRTG